MVHKTRFKKITYFWFLPFAMGVCLSGGYIVTSKILLKASKSKNISAESHQLKSNILSEKEQSKYNNNEVRESISDKITNANTESGLKTSNQKLSSGANTPKIKKDPNQESALEKQIEKPMTLIPTSSDKLQKIFNELFQTLPKP